MKAKIDQRLFVLALSLVKGLGPIVLRRLLNQMATKGELFNYHISEEGEGHFPEGVRKLLAQVDLESARQVSKECDRLDIRWMTVLDDEYPLPLKHLPDGPAVLYYKGDLPNEAERLLGVVGTRRVTDYGRRVISELMVDMEKFEPTIVSGLAHGADIIAHRESLKRGFKNIGVLAGGLDKIYPDVHTEIARDIEKQGVVISEYPPGVRPVPGSFPARNRLIAGLSQGLVVIESADKGGSMITANLAFEYSREVFAIPGRIGDKLSEGCNSLIADNKAQLLTSYEVIPNALGWTAGSFQLEMNLIEELSQDEKELYSKIKEHSPCYYEYLSQLGLYSSSKLAELILTLELKGLISTLPGPRYVVVR